MTERFTSARVAVTGAAGGLGSRLCRLFAAEGGEVWALDQDEAGLERLAPNAAVVPIAVDLTDTRAVESAFASIGPLDVLVNNAGVTALGPAAEVPVSAFEHLVDVNLLGSIRCTKAALPGLIERRGRIGVISSVAGFAPLVYRAGYSASKHGLHGFFESLRAELDSTEVSVTLICPSFVDTGIANRAVHRVAGEAGEWSTTGRVSDPDRVARVIVESLRLRRRLVLPSATARMAWVMSRMSPRRYEQIMLRRVAR